MWIALDVRMILGKDAAEELVLGVVDGLDDEAVVARKVEERAGLAGRAELGEYVLCGEREEVVRGVEVEVVFTQLTEDPRCVVLEFKVVFSRGSEFVANARSKSA